MDNSAFPIDRYISSLVNFLDEIEYHDENFHPNDRLQHLQHVYAETAKHFAQPLQQETLKVSPTKLAAVMRTSVQLVVYCWTKVSPRVMVAISIYFVYIVFLDDSSIDPHPDMSSFSEDLLHGRDQKHPFWRLMNGHFSDFLCHYGSFCGFTIMRSTFDFFQGCWIETRSFRGHPGSSYYPLFLRRLNGLGGICGGSLFPGEDFDEKKCFNDITTAIAMIEPMVAFVNDLISFYKEYDNERDQSSLVTNYCHVEGISLDQAFDRLTNDTIHSCERLLAVLSSENAPEVAGTIHAFVHGYVTWHFCDERFRMQEVYERSRGCKEGERFRRYYEAATRVGSIDKAAWAVSPTRTNDEIANGETKNGGLTNGDTTNGKTRNGKTTNGEIYSEMWYGKTTNGGVTNGVH